jgi:hypothetical protein
VVIACRSRSALPKNWLMPGNPPQANVAPYT